MKTTHDSTPTVSTEKSYICPITLLDRYFLSLILISSKTELWCCSFSSGSEFLLDFSKRNELGNCLSIRGLKAKNYVPLIAIDHSSSTLTIVKTNRKTIPNFCLAVLQRVQTSHGLTFEMKQSKNKYHSEIVKLKKTLPNWSELYCQSSRETLVPQLIRLEVLGQPLCRKYSWVNLFSVFLGFLGFTSFPPLIRRSQMNVP